MTLDIRGLAPLLQVFDMPASIHFYRDILGFEVVNTSRPGEDFGWALLRLNGVELMLTTAYENDERPPFRTPIGRPHMATRVCTSAARMLKARTSNFVPRALM